VGRTELASGLELRQTTVPIGVLLIIFESRPDCLPQIASLAIKSGNGLLLKGGKEAKHSNRLLHSLVAAAVEAATKGVVGGGVVGLVETRNEISGLLGLTQHIDLVVPRGSYKLVNHIKTNTLIPVLGHAEGICHVYVDAQFDLAMAIRLIRDAKLHYPAACNAAETLLLDAAGDPSTLATLLKALKSAGIRMYGGPELMGAEKWSALAGEMEGALMAGDRKAAGFSNEWGDERLSVEVVSGVEGAIAHINTHGSGHTDAIVTTSREHAVRFQQGVCSACVFHNASTRFADGYRFGLGAEVGISTGKIHARGPVGVEGLTTTKWALASEREKGHIVGDFDAGDCKYTHKKLGMQ
jgi:gamma-glutamyl phosphate reductase